AGRHFERLHTIGTAVDAGRSAGDAAFASHVDRQPAIATRNKTQAAGQVGACDDRAGATGVTAPVRLIAVHTRGDFALPRGTQSSREPERRRFVEDHARALRKTRTARARAIDARWTAQDAAGAFERNDDGARRRSRARPTCCTEAVET